MRQITKIGILLPAISLAAAACATSDSVREMFAKKDAELDQRFVAVEGRVNETAEHLDRVSSQVNDVAAQVKKLEGAVAGAQKQAEVATSKAGGVDSRLTRLWSNRYNQKVADTLDLYFALDSAELPDAAQTALLGVAKELEASPTLIVELGGYTDPKGTVDYNYALSQRRVEAVRRFLLEKGIQLSRIRTVSLGPITAGGTPDAKKRRVTVKLMADQD